ncbi:MAG: ABC transporter ATP-binding protein [Chloroflexota bacterium]|nr:ABC transporter ATP-binding protein [Chloroflexota bacterium]
MESTTLVLDSLVKTFGRRGQVRAVNGVNIEINQGEFVTLLGPSGCGKTTTLRLIAGFEFPTSGRILLDGEAINDVPPNKRPMAMVFQNYALFPHMSVFDNISYGLKVKKQPPDLIRESVEIVMQLMNLVGLGGRMPHQLSGGQQQRVALARALVMQPKVLLFDEPLSNLDAKLRVQMRVEIRRLQQRLGITTVYVTHDQAEAMSLSDRIVVMHDGQIEQVGTPSEIYQQPASLFVADFIGKANFIESAVQGQVDGRMTFDLFGHPLTIPAPQGEFAAGDPIYLVIRPEAVRLSRQEGSLTGEVKQTVYLGSTVEYEVETHDQFISVVIYDPQQGDVLEEGSRVFLDLPDDAFHVLPRRQ